MKVELPTRLKGFKCERLFAVEMNDFDIEMLLPAIFYVIRTGSKVRKHRPDSQDIDKYVKQLGKHELLENFQEELDLLGKWIRTSLINTGKIGRAHRGEQILYIKPLSLLSYKPGFPADWSRLRQVDKFIYKVLNDFLGSNEEKYIFRSVFKDVFSKGLNLPEDANYSGKYDGVSQLDTETLLLLYFLDGFSSNPPKKYGNTDDEITIVCKEAAKIIAEDLILFVSVYRDRVPTSVLVTYLMALLNFELFIYTLKLIRTINTFFQKRELPVEMGGNLVSTPCELYLDVTHEQGKASDLLAIRCVNRDLEEIRRYFGCALRIRLLDNYVTNAKRLLEQAPDKSESGYLKYLLDIEYGEGIEIRAERDWEEIEELWKDKEIPEEIIKQLEKVNSNYEKIIKLLEETQSKEGVKKYIQWFWSVGGLTKSYGLMSGNLTGKRVWRYTLSDTLLETLIQLFAILHPIKFLKKNYIWKKSYPIKQRKTSCFEELIPIYSNGDSIEPISPHAFPLKDFIAFLNERYGILIDTPPKDMITSETLEATSKNFQALKDRLRNMGVFQDLSDDFTAQVITPHYIEKTLVK